MSELEDAKKELNGLYRLVEQKSRAIADLEAKHGPDVLEHDDEDLDERAAPKTEFTMDLKTNGASGEGRVKAKLKTGADGFKVTFEDGEPALAAPKGGLIRWPQMFDELAARASSEVMKAFQEIEETPFRFPIPSKPEVNVEVKLNYK